jgi:hypothetical protein
MMRSLTAHHLIQFPNTIIDPATGILSKNIKLQAEANPTNLAEDFYIDR